MQERRKDSGKEVIRDTIKESYKIINQSINKIVLILFPCYLSSF